MGQKTNMTVEVNSNYLQEPEAKPGSSWNGVVQQNLSASTHHNRNKRKLGPTGLKAQIVDHQVGEENPPPCPLGHSLSSRQSVTD